MKKISFYRFLSLSLGLITMASCSDSSSPEPSATPVDVAPMVNIASQGTWRVTNYSDHGENETDHFAGYNFTFGSGNALTADNGSITYTGTWNVTGNSFAKDESPSDAIDFNIYFDGPMDFSDISDDWDIISISDTKMDFIDISAEVGKKPDKITFEKN